MNKKGSELLVLPGDRDVIAMPVISLDMVILLLQPQARLEGAAWLPYRNFRDYYRVNANIFSIGRDEAEQLLAEVVTNYLIAQLGALLIRQQEAAWDAAAEAVRALLRERFSSIRILMELYFSTELEEIIGLNVRLNLRAQERE